MTRYFLVSVSTLERWKRKLARSESHAVWVEIEQFRASGGEPIESLWTQVRWTWDVQLIQKKVGV